MKFAMHFILIVLTLAVGSKALAEKQDLNKHSGDASLMNFISRSSAALQENPQRSVSCFDYYVPLLNQLGLDYQERFEKCLSVAEAAIIEAENDTEEDRKQLASESEAACTAVKECGSNSEASAEDIFQCYVTSGSDSSKSLYKVSTAATVKLATLQEVIRRIENEENICVTNNRIQYEKESTETYEEFSSCILGNSEVPTSTSSTESTTPTEPSTSEEMPEKDIFRLIKRLKHFRG